MKTIHGHFTPLLRHVLYSSLCFVTEKFGFFSRAQKLEKGPHRKGTEPVTQFSIWRVAAEGRDEDGDNCCNRKECCKYSFYSPCQGRALGLRGSAEGGVRGQRFSATCWSQTSTGSCVPTAETLQQAQLMLLVVQRSLWEPEGRSNPPSPFPPTVD